MYLSVFKQKCPSTYRYLPLHITRSNSLSEAASSAASFAELRLPPPLAKTCGAELHAGLHTIALCSRQQAPQTMRTLAALCHRTAQGQYAAAQQAAVLAPKLGLCGGLLAAILLWPAG